MPGLSSSLYIGLSGLQAQQAALGVVGHNIANVNTPGYTRQRADLTSNLSMTEGQLYFGTGVTLNAVQGIRDRFLDLQIYRETAKQSGADERYSGIAGIATTVGDTTNTGVSAQIQAFFQAFQDLASQPESTALRTNVVGKAQSMITALQSRYEMLDQQRNNADQSVGSLVTEVNTLTSTLFRRRKDRFEASALPAEAQFVPAFGIAVGDLNGDGTEDLFLSQNFTAISPSEVV